MTVGVGDVLRVVAEWDVPDGTIAQMVFHYLGVSGTTATEAQFLGSVESRIDTAWNQIEARISDLVLGSTVEAYVWDFVLNRWDGIGQVPLIGADGGDAGEMLPHGAAALVKFFTAALRRQARKYVPGLSESQVADGTILGVAVSDLALWAADMDDDVIAGGLTLSFCTFNTDPASPLFETTSLNTQAVQAEAVVAYQRRRRPGTGI